VLGKIPGNVGPSRQERGMVRSLLALHQRGFIQHREKGLQRELRMQKGGKVHVGGSNPGMAFGPGGSGIKVFRGIQEGE